MRQKLIFIFLLLLPFMLRGQVAKHVVISGHIAKPTDDSVSFKVFITDADYVLYRPTEFKAKVDAAGNFRLKANVPGVRPFMLANGVEKIFPWWMYISPGDSLYFNVNDTGGFTVKGRGKEAIEYSRAYWSQYWTVRTDPGLPYILMNEARRQRQLAYLDSIAWAAHFSSELHQVLREEIHYNCAMKRLDRIDRSWMEMTGQQRLKPTKTYLDSIQRMVTPWNFSYAYTYHQFLRDENHYFWDLKSEAEAGDNAELKKVFVKQYYQIRAAAADTIRSPRQKEMVLALIIKDAIQSPDPSERHRLITDSLLKILQRVQTDPAGGLYAALSNAANEKYGLRGTVAPDFTLKDLNGKPIKLSGFRGKVVLLDFWSPGCSPCVAAIPSSNNLQAKMKGKPLEVVTVCTWLNQEQIKKFTKERKWKGTHLMMDDKQKIIQDYRVEFYPMYVLIDKKGLIRYMPAPGPDSEELMPLIEELLKEK